MRGLVKGLLAAVAVLALAGSAVTTATAQEQPGPLTPNIIGGVDATENYSFMASMQGNSGGHFCGGALIRPTWVLTAKHCMAGEVPSGVQIRIGSNNRNSGGTVARVRRWVTHGNADMSLVELTAPVAQQPISIAPVVAPGSTVRLLDWAPRRARPAVAAHPPTSSRSRFPCCRTVRVRRRPVGDLPGRQGRQERLPRRLGRSASGGFARHGGSAATRPGVWGSADFCYRAPGQCEHVDQQRRRP